MAALYPALRIAGTAKSQRGAEVAKATRVRKGAVAAVLFIARLHFR
jgi:hypothetical protein